MDADHNRYVNRQYRVSGIDVNNLQSGNIGCVRKRDCQKVQCSEITGSGCQVYKERHVASTGVVAAVWRK